MTSVAPGKAAVLGEQSELWLLAAVWASLGTMERDVSLVGKKAEGVPLPEAPLRSMNDPLRRQVSGSCLTHSSHLKRSITCIGAS